MRSVILSVILAILNVFLLGLVIRYYFNFIIAKAFIIVLKIVIFATSAYIFYKIIDKITTIRS